MQKRILKKIAKEWCAGILLACDGDSFDEDVDGLTSEEVDYILNEVEKIAVKINDKQVPETSVKKIVEKYYSFE